MQFGVVGEMAFLAPLSLGKLPGIGAKTEAALAEHGLIAADDLNLFSFAEDAEGVWSCLLKGGLRPHESIEAP